MTYYTYTYHTLEDATPTYVGKGTGTRWKAHCRQSTDTRFSRHVKKQLSKDLFPIVIPVRQVSEQAALDEEVRLIAKYGRRDLGTGSLYNLTDGGEGVSGHKHSPKTRAKLSAKSKAQDRTKHAAVMRGRPLTAEHKAKVAAAGLGRNVTSATRTKLSTALKGRKFSPETLARMSASQKRRFNKE